MKIDIIVVHITLLAAVAIPYLLFILAAARQRKKLEIKFLSEVKQMGLTLDKNDSWNTNIIGIDQTQQIVLLIQQNSLQTNVEVLDLKTVKSSYLLHHYRNIKINRKNEEILQRVELELSLYDGQKRSILLFDDDIHNYQDYEMNHAIKWNQIIQDSIRLRPLIQSAA